MHQQSCLKQKKSCVRNGCFLLEVGIDRLFLVASSICIFYKCFKYVCVYMIAAFMQSCHQGKKVLPGCHLQLILSLKI